MTTPPVLQDFMSFIKSSPTAAHTVDSIIQRLKPHNFTHLPESVSWTDKIKPGGKYYITRNHSSLIAFAVGREWRPGNPIALVGTHTDSPNLLLKPSSKRTSEGYLQIGVMPYGGGLWHTWFDRDLSIAGKVMVRTHENDDKTSAKSETGKVVVQRLVDLERPIVRIPNLAIHLTDRGPTFTVNKETHLVPILGLVQKEVNRPVEEEEEKEEEEEEGVTRGGAQRRPLETRADLSEPLDQLHHPALLAEIAQKLAIAPEDIVDFELSLYDTQGPVLGGVREEFINSGRQDNLNSTFCAVQSLVQSSSEEALDKDTHLRVIACFDHEEIGSTSATGADSDFLANVLRRIVASTHPADAPTPSDAVDRSFARSFLLSSDVSHAIHPNYRERYESNHTLRLNGGPGIKVNASQRYATNTPGIALIKEVARRSQSPLQYFVVRNDSPCGSTIGPLLASKLGLRTLDIGNPILAMHSIREMAGSRDIEYLVKLFQTFFDTYGELEQTHDLA